MTGKDTAPDPRLAALVAAVAAADAPPFIAVPAELLADGELRAALRREAWYVSTLDRAPIFDKTTLLHALYQSAECPAGFGFNWDALLDRLRDLEWLEPARGIAFVWRHPDVLEERAPDIAATFREIVEEAAAHRAEHGYPPLRVLVPAGWRPQPGAEGR